MIEKRPISPSLLGKAALRIGAREAQNDLGLVLAGLRRGPMPVSLPALDDLAALIPPEQRQHAEAILTAARGIVDWLATQEDAALAAAPIAGCA